MPAPHLTFACELPAAELNALMTDALIADLSELGAAISLGILDLSPERAEVVRRLNQGGVAVIGWLLLPTEQGYYFTIDNYARAGDFYQQFRTWARAEGAQFAAIGLDIEPDIRDYADLADDRLQNLPKWLGRFFRFRQLSRARQAYAALVEQIHADGYLVESYQFPFITDDRHARTTLIQRLTGMVDVSVDREVLMLYSSIFRPRGAAMIASYGPEAQAVGLGSTGGGVVAPGVPVFAPISWEEFARDLRLAWHYSDQVFIFSLEGCVQQGFIEHLKTFVWDQPILLPQTARVQVDAWRGSLWSALWLVERLPAILSGVVGLIVVFRQLRKRRRESM